MGNNESVPESIQIQVDLMATKLEDLEKKIWGIREKNGGNGTEK